MSIFKLIAVAATALSLALNLSCANTGPRPETAKRTMFTNQQISNVQSKKAFFGHQSVGNNLLDGIRDLAATDARLKLNIVKSSDPQSVAGPALVEFEIGRNGDPQSKIDAFTSVLDRGYGAQGGVAMFKFCYVDIDASTNVPTLFAAYRDRVKALKAKYPAWKPVHITVPLTTVELSAKAWLKGVLGRTTTQDINLKRNQFNTLLRSEYSGIDPVFDLAEVESTQADGSRSYFTRGGERVFTLAPEFTDDGGHLNREGRRFAAERFLSFLAAL